MKVDLESKLFYSSPCCRQESRIVTIQIWKEIWTRTPIQPFISDFVGQYCYCSIYDISFYLLKEEEISKEMIAKIFQKLVAVTKLKIQES